jgi:hypothetical protein
MFIMITSKESGVGDSREVYTPPCVVRISDLKQGAGICTPTGSGDIGDCCTGNNPGAVCGTGNGQQICPMG